MTGSPLQRQRCRSTERQLSAVARLQRRNAPDNRPPARAARARRALPIARSSSASSSGVQAPLRSPSSSMAGAPRPQAQGPGRPARAASAASSPGVQQPRVALRSPELRSSAQLPSARQLPLARPRQARLQRLADARSASARLPAPVVPYRAAAALAGCRACRPRQPMCLSVIYIIRLRTSTHGLLHTVSDQHFTRTARRAQPVPAWTVVL